LFKLFPDLSTEAVTLVKIDGLTLASWEYLTQWRQEASQSLLSCNDVEFVNLSRLNSTTKLNKP